jgi:hypothetical protein
VLQKTLGYDIQEVTTGCTIPNEELHKTYNLSVYYGGDLIKQNKLGRACSTQWSEQKYVNNLSYNT